MPKIAARNASLYLENSSGASTAVSGDLNQITFTRSAEAPDVTSFGNDNRQRLSNGIKEWEISFNAFFNTTAAALDEILHGILSGSTVFKFGPSGSTSTCIMYTACGVLTEYNADFTVEGAATVSGTIVARTGSVTRTTWPA